MYNTTSCSTRTGNTGAQKYCGPVGKDRILVLVPKGTEIATETLAVTLSTWTNSINAAKSVRWFPLIPVINAEATQEDPVVQEFDFGYSSYVRDGKLMVRYTLEEMSVYNKTQLAKLNNGDFDVFIVTDKGVIKGYSTDDIKFLPKETDYVRILPESQNTGSETAHVMVEIKYTDVKQFNEYEVVVNPITSELAPANWYPETELTGIKDLVISVSDMDATSATITLKGYDNVAYSAAVAGDLYMRKTSTTGNAITISSLTETATPGTYTAAFASQTAGTFYFSLYDQPTATTEGFETPVTVSYVFSS